MLMDDYLERACHLGRGVGISPVCEMQVDLRRAKNRTQATQLLIDVQPENAYLIILDEWGKNHTSTHIAQRLADLRDNHIRHLYFIIGDADGFDLDILPAQTERWALGIQTWPHKLIRVMLCEQIYRALAILAHTPYHRS